MKIRTRGQNPVEAFRDRLCRKPVAQLGPLSVRQKNSLARALCPVSIAELDLKGLCALFITALASKNLWQKVMKMAAPALVMVYKGDPSPTRSSHILRLRLSDSFHSLGQRAVGLCDG